MRRWKLTNELLTSRASDQTEEDLEVIEITASSPEPEDTTEKVPTPDVMAPKPPSSPRVKREAESTSLLAEIYRRGGFVFSSSGSDQSVSAYCSRKVEALSPKVKKSASVISTTEPKVSVSEPIRLAPTVPTTIPVTESCIQNQNLSLSAPQLHSSIRDRIQGTKYPKSKVTINAPPIEFVFSSALEHPVLSGASTSSRMDRQSKILSDEEVPMSCGETGGQAVSDPESVHPKRSTLADAFSAPVRNFAPALSLPSYASPDEVVQRSGEPAPLSINSQELIRTYFEKTPSFSLPQGHPTISVI